MINSDNLVNWIVLLLLVMWFIMDRWRCDSCLTQEQRYADDYENDEPSPVEEIASLRQFVYDSDHVKKAEIVEQIARLEQALLCDDESPPEGMRIRELVSSRVSYAARTIESACWLAQSTTDKIVSDAIIVRATFMLNSVWETEVKANLASSSFFKEAFWNAVTARLSNETVYVARVVCDTTVNPANSNGYNVVVTVQPAKAAINYQFALSVNL